MYHSRIVHGFCWRNMGMRGGVRRDNALCLSSSFLVGVAIIPQDEDKHQALSLRRLCVPFPGPWRSHWQLSSIDEFEFAGFDVDDEAVNGNCGEIGAVTDDGDDLFDVEVNITEGTDPIYEATGIAEVFSFD